MEHLSSSKSQMQYPVGFPTDPNGLGDGPKDAFWSASITIQAFVQRLSLMADLELPCTVCLGDTQEDRACRGVIRECARRNGRLSILGDHFSLHLVEDHIESMRIVNRRRAGDTEAALEIFGADGNLIARILSTPDRQRAAVWQDIMDSLTFAAA